MVKSYSVIAFPLLTITPPSAKEGTDVTLSCSTTSTPTVTRYAFFRGDDEIGSGSKDTYTFKAETEQSLDYKCSVTNAVGTETSATQILDFQCKIIIIDLVHQQEIMKGLVIV